MLGLPVLLVAGCTSDSGEAQSASTPGTAVTGPTGGSPSGTGASGTGAPGTAAPGGSGPGGSGPATSGESASSSAGGAGQELGSPPCVKLPAIAAATLKPVTDSPSGDKSESLKFGGRVSWDGKLTVSVAAPTKEYTPTAQEKQDAVRQFAAEGKESDKKITPAYRLLPVTVANNTGEAYDATRVLSGSLYSGLETGDTLGAVQGAWLGERPESLVLADGEQTTLELPIAVADGRSIQFLPEPWGSSSDATFSTQGTLATASYSKPDDEKGVAAAAFGKPAEANGVTVVATAPAPYRPSPASGAVTAKGAMAGSVTLTNTNDEPVDLRRVQVNPVVGTAACGVISDPALGTGLGPQLLAPKASATVTYAFSAADPAAGDVRLTLTVPEAGPDPDMSDNAQVFFSGKPGSEPPAPADPAKTAAAVIPVAKGTSSGMTFGKPVRWQDATQATVAVSAPKPLPKDVVKREGSVVAEPGARAVTVTLTLQGTGAKTMESDPGVLVVGDGKVAAVSDVDTEAGEGSVQWTGTFYVPGADKPTVVLAPPGREPVWAAGSNPGELEIGAVSPGPGPALSTTLDKPVELPGGVSMQVSAPKPDAQESSDAATGSADDEPSASSPPRAFGQIRLTNTSDKAVPMAPQVILVDGDGRQLSQRATHSSGEAGALVDAASPLPPGATFTTPYYVPPGARPVLATPGGGFGWVRLQD